MEPRFLRQLAEIIDLGSMSLAARSLNVSQPTLSRNIKSLETFVKAPLLRRGRYGVTPTAVGELLAREGRTIRDALWQAEAGLANWQSSLDGKLHLGVGTMLAHSIMPAFLADLATSQLNIALRIDVASADKLLEHVRARKLDLAIVEFGPFVQREGLAELPLIDDPRAFYVGETHPLANAARVTAAQLQAASHIRVGSFSDEWNGPWKGSTASSGGSTIELSGDVSIALHLLATGRFVAMLPQCVMRNLSDPRPFRQLAYKGPMPSKRLSIWRRVELGGHPLVERFSKRFTKFMQDLQSESEAMPRRLRRQRTLAHTPP